MIRGRHRGLPVAIDRAVLIPPEFSRDDDDNEGPSLPHINTISESASGIEERGRRPSAEMRQRPQRRFSGSEGGSVARRGVSRPRERSISFGVQN